MEKSLFQHEDRPSATQKAEVLVDLSEATPANIGSISQQYDKRLLENRNADMRGIMIFSGLLSVVLTAFLIESSKSLKPKPNDSRTVELLMHISQQLASPSPSSTPAAVSQEPSPPSTITAALVCNILWSISLVLSLTCTLLATLFQQWTRELLFLPHREEETVPTRRRRRVFFSFLHQFHGHMHNIIDAISLIPPVSLLLFFAGLIPFLFHAYKVVVFLMFYGIFLVVMFSVGK